ncbi:MAG: hypothetical protein RLZ68_190 [Pseudomonadota bacterium]|jgi:hypothetical protein
MPIKKRKTLVRAFDPEFRFLLDIDPALEGWRAWAPEYWAGLPSFDTTIRAGMTAFLIKYLFNQGLHTLPAEAFFALDGGLPALDCALGLDLIPTEYPRKKKHDGISDFLDWILQTRLAVLDADGDRTVPSHLANPFPRIQAKKHGKESDLSFAYVLKLDPKLDDWRSVAAEWMKDQKIAIHQRRQAIDTFLIDYIHGQNLERNYGRLLLRETEKPDFSQMLVGAKREGTQSLNVSDLRTISTVVKFLDWILATKLGDPETGEWDRSRFHNPVQRITNYGLARKTQSDKASLSIRYIRELRGMLAEGHHFRDWTWAQQVIEDGRNGSDWFLVDPSLIDPRDPDCVARQRNATKYEMGVKGYPAEVWEVWSPVRAVALYIKLELPLRSFQVRMLDSGEADTWRYIHSPGGGGFVLNHGPLATGSEKRPSQSGVFHRTTNEKEAGFYINTNKTADIGKAEKDKGYVIPWANDEVLYWLEKLRNWQERYNPITAPTPWTELGNNHFGYTPPHTDVLAQRSSACFLFRNPTDVERDKPLHSHSLGSIWYKLLARLEKRCADYGEKLDNGTPLRFVDPDSNKTTSFPLHALRVSLISYFILDLKMPIAVVSKMIAGHATIIMTLYYTKFGKAYMREVLSDAEKNELEAERTNHRRFLADATLEQVSQRFAYVSEDAVRSAISNQGAEAAFVFDDKGICPNGARSCDVGGERIGAESHNNFTPVPGFPQERNCVCCRFFLTGPAFVPGLMAHFNSVSEKIKRQSARHSSLQDKLTYLEDEQREAERENQPFVRLRELDALNKHVESEALILNKYLNDFQATNHLIQRSMQIAKDKTTEGVKLVAKGSMTDLKVGFIESQSVLHQLEVVCENAVIYPDIDPGFANIRRSQMLDAMMRYNGMEPVMMYLKEDEQLLVGNAVMQLIQARTGSIQSALPYAECHLKLQEIGIVKSKVLDEIAHVKAKMLIDHSKTQLTLAPPTGDKNAS